MAVKHARASPPKTHANSASLRVQSSSVWLGGGKPAETGHRCGHDVRPSTAAHSEASAKQAKAYALQSNCKPERCLHDCFQPLQVPVLLKARHARRPGLIGRRYVLDVHIRVGAPRRAHLPLAQPRFGQKANLRAGTSHSAAATVAGGTAAGAGEIGGEATSVEGAAAGAESSSRRLRTKLAAGTG